MAIAAAAEQGLISLSPLMCCCLAIQRGLSLLMVWSRRRSDCFIEVTRHSCLCSSAVRPLRSWEHARHQNMGDPWRIVWDGPWVWRAGLSSVAWLMALMRPFIEAALRWGGLPLLCLGPILTVCIPLTITTCKPLSLKPVSSSVSAVLISHRGLVISPRETV